MAVNTAQLDGTTVLSGLSLNGPSSATLAASDGTFGGNLTVQGTSTFVGATTNSAAEYLPDGTASAPSQAYTSEKSLGWYRSGASVEALSYGTLDLRGGALAFSSGTTAQSAATAKVGQAQMIFSILSLTTNGAAIYFRSGNSTYVWPSSGVIG